MRQKTGFTLVEQAIALIPEFEKVVRKLEQQVTLRGQSRSTLQNYNRRIALFVMRFEKLPEQTDPEEINEYLAALARDPKSPSRSSFKHMVYGLRYYYRLMGMNREAIVLPSLKKVSGLRGQEVINLRISDVDIERKTIHIRQSKYKKDRVVPLADCMAVGLKKYLGAENPQIWLFNGKEREPKTTPIGVSKNR